MASSGWASMELQLRPLQLRLLTLVIKWPELQLRSPTLNQRSTLCTCSHTDPNTPIFKHSFHFCLVSAA